MADIVRTGRFLLVLLACTGLGQESDSIQVDVDVVNVLCTVYDRHGALVKDLNKDDFEIRENGKRQQIRYFARETDLPLSLALLVDVSASVRTIVDQEKATAAEFLQKVVRPADRALLLGFSESIILWQDFTPSADLLRTALGRVRPVHNRSAPGYSPFAGTLLYDAVFLAATEKLDGIPGRKAMVVISDGVDTGSQSKAEDAVRGLQTTNTILYGICYEPPGEPSGCSYLKDLASPTGGRMFKIGKNTSLAKIFATIEEELRSQYALGYVSTNPLRDGKFRKLEVRVKPSGLRVEARKGYYARKTR